MSTPTKSTAKKGKPKVEKVELPNIKLEPRGNVNPEKQSNQIEEKFDTLLKIFNEIRADMATDSKQAKEDRARFQQIHTECKEKADQV